MNARVGQHIGNYRLSSLIGRGGYGEVYLADHVYLDNRRAAIKILDAQLESEEAANFRDEASIIANLKHPHIVNVQDFGIDGSTPYLIMDKLQVLPTEAKPILKWSSREDAFMNVARGIQKEIEKLLSTL